MMTWLDDEEANVALCHTDEKYYPIRMRDPDRALRVISELTGHIEDVKAWAEYAGLFLFEITEKDAHLERLRATTADSWNNLSTDTKELFEKEIENV